MVTSYILIVLNTENTILLHVRRLGKFFFTCGSDINFISGDSCPTIEGASYFGKAGQVGVPCKFPFSVSRASSPLLSIIGSLTFGPFDACIDLVDFLGAFGAAYSGLLCATEVDGNGNAIEFGHCDPKCLSGK